MPKILNPAQAAEAVIGKKVAVIDFDDVIGETTADFFRWMERNHGLVPNQANGEYYEDQFEHGGKSLNEALGAEKAGETVWGWLSDYFSERADRIPQTNGAVEAISKLIDDGFEIVCLTNVTSSHVEARAKNLSDLDLNALLVPNKGSKTDAYKTIAEAASFVIVIDDNRIHIAEALEAAPEAICVHFLGGGCVWDKTILVDDPRAVVSHSWSESLDAVAKRKPGQRKNSI